MQHSKAHTFEIIDRALTQAQTQVCQRLKQLDPWRADYGANACELFDEVAKAAAPQILYPLEGLRPEDALRQAWTIAIQTPLQVGLLFRVGNPFNWPVALDGDSAYALERERYRLAELSKSRWRERNGYCRAEDLQVAAMLLCTDPARMPVPNLGKHTGLPGLARLRFKLAALASAGTTFRGLLEAATYQTRVDHSQRRRELEHVLYGMDQAGRRWRALREAEVAYLTEKEQEVLLGLRGFKHRVLVRSLWNPPEGMAKRFCALREEGERLQKQLNALVFATWRLDFGGVEGVNALWLQWQQTPPTTALDEATQNSVLRAAMRQAGQRAVSLGVHRGESMMRIVLNTWQPMALPAYEFLEACAGRPMPRWWTLPRDELAARLRAGDIDVPKNIWPGRK